MIEKSKPQKNRKAKRKKSKSKSKRLWTSIKYSKWTKNSMQSWIIAHVVQYLVKGMTYTYQISVIKTIIGQIWEKVINASILLAQEKLIHSLVEVLNFLLFSTKSGGWFSDIKLLWVITLYFFDLIRIRASLIFWKLYNINEIVEVSKEKVRQNSPSKRDRQT